MDWESSEKGLEEFILPFEALLSSWDTKLHQDVVVFFW